MAWRAQRSAPGPDDFWIEATAHHLETDQHVHRDGHEAHSGPYVAAERGVSERQTDECAQERADQEDARGDDLAHNAHVQPGPTHRGEYVHDCRLGPLPLLEAPVRRANPTQDDI